MSKYINADRLKAEIEKPKNELKVGNYYLDNSEQAVGYENALIDFELLIDSLQQEQPEVDLENEIKSWILNECGPSDFSPFADHWCADDIMATARHFYELGLKVGKEETK